MIVTAAPLHAVPKVGLGSPAPRHLFFGRWAHTPLTHCAPQSSPTRTQEKHMSKGLNQKKEQKKKPAKSMKEKKAEKKDKKATKAFAPV